MEWNSFSFPPLPRERNRRELMDDLSTQSREGVRTALRDLERVNRIFGNHRLLTRYLSDLSRSIPPGEEITLLDIGTGGGDLPAAVVRWAERLGRKVRMIAMDRSEEILKFARDRLRECPSTGLLRGDAVQLPFPDRSVDIVFCSQVLHHLPEAVAVKAISEMKRICRVGWIISDLRRSRLAYRATQAAMRLVSRSPMIRFDGPLSILRSYTLEEYRGLVRAGGADRATIRKHRFFRAGIVYHRKKAIPRGKDPNPPPEGLRTER